MPISQPSPDRLVFQPKYKSIISFQIIYGMLIICYLSIAGASVVAGALLFSFVLSKSLAASYLNILNDPSRVSMIILVCIFISLFAGYYFYLAWLLLRHQIADSCTFDRTTSLASDLYFGEAYIQQRNIFNRKRTIIIPLDKIVDIRVQHLSWLYLGNFNIVLNTSLSAKPIYISKLIQNVKPTLDLRSIEARLAIVPSLIREIELIREFLYLPPKPSYLVNESIDCLVQALQNFYKSKILKETSHNFTYYRLCKLPWYSETWDFDSNLSIVTIEYRYFGKKVVRRIAMDMIRSIVIKRELSTPMDSIGETFNCQVKERYSAILVPIESSSKSKNDYRAFYIPGSLPNGYRRLYTSESLSETKDFAERLNCYLNLANQESNIQLTHQ
jgi:hypothetical protein